MFHTHLGRTCQHAVHDDGTGRHYIYSECAAGFSGPNCDRSDGEQGAEADIVDGNLYTGSDYRSRVEVLLGRICIPSHVYSN